MRRLATLFLLIGLPVCGVRCGGGTEEAVRGTATRAVSSPTSERSVEPTSTAAVFSPTPDPSKVVAQVDTVDGRTVKLAGPFSISPVYELRVGAFQLFHIDFTRIEQVDRTVEGTFVAITDGERIEVAPGAEGEFEGTGELGKEGTPLSLIQRIRFEGTVAHARADDVEGVLRLEDGTEWRVHGVRFSGIGSEGPFRSPLGEGEESLVALSTETHEYWLAESWLLKRGFSQGELGTVASCSVTGVCPAGLAKFLLTFQRGGLELLSNLGEIRDYAPVEAGGTEEIVGATWRVAWTGWGGDSYEALASDIRFLQYRPPPAGYRYIQRGAGWQVFDTLAVTRPEGSKADVDFGRLARIEFPERYDVARKAVLTTASGDTADVTISPDEPSGSTSYEGLLCVVNSAINVWIPFERVKWIDLTAP